MAKRITILYFVIQYRRKQRIGSKLPDGQWYDRPGQEYETADDCASAINRVITMPGAYLFQWRVSSPREKVISTARVNVNLHQETRV